VQGKADVTADIGNFGHQIAAGGQIGHEQDHRGKIGDGGEIE
jgi:hypothetical protein